MRISDWSSDVCSSDLDIVRGFVTDPVPQSAVAGIVVIAREQPPAAGIALHARDCLDDDPIFGTLGIEDVACDNHMFHLVGGRDFADPVDGVEAGFAKRRAHLGLEPAEGLRSEEHTSELQSLMRISYAVFCLQKQKTRI